MTTREKLDYRNRAEEDENLDYRDEITEGKEEHQTEHPNSSYQAANQHMVKFKDELKAINEKTATDFDFRKNPAEYDLAERKEALEAVEHAFNKTQWNSSWERRIAAEDIAQNSFQPMYRRIELAEAAAQHKIPEEFLAAVKEEQIEYAEENQTEDGAKVLEFHVKDIETAQRLVEHSKGAFEIVSTWQLDHYRDQFADALYESDKNPNAAEQMGKFLEQGINYYNGEISRDANLDRKTEKGNTFQQDDEAASGKQQMAKEEVEYDEPSYAEMVTFRRLENLDEEALDHEVSELVHQKLQHTETYLEELQKAEHRDADAVAEVQRTLHEAAHDGIQSSVEKGDEENFSKILRNIEEANRELALKMWERKGFIEGSPDYQQPVLPDEFKNVTAAAEYADQVEVLTEEYQKDISSMNYMLLKQMLERMDTRREALETVQEEWDKAGYRPGDEVPPGVTHPRDLAEDFQEMHNIAAGLDYLMRVEDPVYWKLNHMDAEEKEEKLDETLQEHLDDARRATGDERGEKVEFLLEILQASFGQHLEYATHAETDLQKQQGKDEATAFRTSHRAILDEMENITDYAKTIRDGTSDITANHVPDPINEFKFDPNNQMYDHEQQKKNYIEDGTTFSLTYKGMIMLRDGQNNEEGSEENMRLLEHVTDRCVEAMREISDNPDSFEDRIQEAIQCSRIMTGMVTVKEREEDPE